MAWHRPTNVNEWVSLVFRHKKKFIFPALVVMIATIWYRSASSPRQYFAEAKFQRVNDPAMVEMGSGTAMANLQAVRAQLWEDITGRAAIEQLINDLKLTEGLPRGADNELTREGRIRLLELVQTLRRRIHVYYETQSDRWDVIVVNFTDRDPEKAANIVNHVVDNYIRKAQFRLTDMLMGAKSFFEEREAAYQVKVDDLSQRKLRFEMDHPGLMPDDPANTRTRLTDLRGQLDGVQRTLAEATAQRNNLQARVKNEPDYLVEKEQVVNPEVKDLLDRKQALEGELEQLRATGHRDAHPLNQRVLERIAAIDKKISGMTKEVLVPKLQVPNTGKQAMLSDIDKLSGTIAALEKERNELSAQVEQYEVLDRNFFAVRNEYLRLGRDLDEAQNQLNFWQDKLRQTAMAYSAMANQKGVRFSILQTATDTSLPVSPTIWGIASVAVALGLAVGLALVVLSELLDGSFHSVEQATDGLKLPILGAVNEITTPGAVFRQRVLGWVVYPGLAAGMVLILLVSLALVWVSPNDPPRFQLLATHWPLSVVRALAPGA